MQLWPLWLEGAVVFGVLLLVLWRRRRGLGVFVCVDHYVFIKNGYSFWTHLVPFAIAGLLLLTLSVPADNLLLKLVNMLQRPSWVWLPATLLTVIAITVYVATLYTQICRAYLWPEGDMRRTIGTSLTYMLLCMLMAYAVLRSAPATQTTLSDIWTCFLLAALSLTGIGWSGPTSWVTSIGVQSPNYTEGRRCAVQLTDILHRVRLKARGEVQDVKEFGTLADNLLKDIDKNLALEPEWARGNMLAARMALQALSRDANRFTPHEAAYFAPACRCQMADRFPSFINALNVVGRYWPEWQCPHPT
jgi:hypothetical protein